MSPLGAKPPEISDHSSIYRQNFPVLRNQGGQCVRRAGIRGEIGCGGGGTAVGLGSGKEQWR